MRLLIDADQIGTLADRFRGVSMQLLNTAKTVRNDAWSAELSNRDTKVKTATEVTGRVATKYEAHAGSLDSQANELKQIESLVRGDHGDQTVLTAVPPTDWGTAPTITPLQPLVTVPKTVMRSITGAITHLDPITVMPNAVAALQSVPTWITPTSSTVVEQVTAQLPEEMLPVKPKKKKGFFGRIFSAIGNFFKKLWNSVKKLAKNLWTALKSTLKNVWLALKNMSFKQLLMLGATLALQFIPGLGQAAAGLLFGAANAARVVTIASAAYRVYNAGRAVYSTIRNGVRGIAGFIGLAGGISGALGSIGTLGTTIGGAATRIGEFATRAGAALTRVTTFVTSGRIFGVISEQLGHVAQRVAGAIGSIIPATGPIADIIRVVGRTATDVVNWVKTAINGVGKVITDAREWIDKSLAAVKARYTSIIDGLTSSIGQVSPKLAELIKTTIHKHIDAGLLTITSSWTELRNAVTARITQALRIVRPIGALLTGNHALFQTTMQAELVRTRLWSGRPRVSTPAVEAQLTPVTDWTPTDPPTPEAVPEADVSTGTPSDTATNPDIADSATIAPQTPETDNVQTVPEAGTSLTPQAVLETSDTAPSTPATTITAPVEAAPAPVQTPASADAVTVDPSVTETPSTPPAAVVGSAKTLDCVYPGLPVVKDPITAAFPSDKALPRCVLPTDSKLPKGLVTPAVTGLGSGILPVIDPAALDALRNNLNITPNGPVATAWVSPISETQSSTMQGLLGLVDPTNEHSSMLRNLVAA